MHDEILTNVQRSQLPLLKKFSRSFSLVGGTAVALHIGHRRSIDFDLFSTKPFLNIRIRKTIADFSPIDKELWNEKGQYTLLVRGVKWTFFHYPHEIPYAEKYREFIKMPDLITLSAMKAYALGQRAKWKDYVDLFFILRDYHSLRQIADRTAEVFGNEFNEKLFRSQLAYFEGIDYREPLDYMLGCEVSDKAIREKLKEFSLS
ncbi:MAG: hypothetical protein AAB738_03610 [Patescibacteria group bacterium]